jgi:hypothetical protein
MIYIFMISYLYVFRETPQFFSVVKLLLFTVT